MDRDFPWAGRAAPQDFPQASPLENSAEQTCQPSENPLHPSSFTWINQVIVKVIVKKRYINTNTKKILHQTPDT